MTDAMLKALAENGGVIQLCLLEGAREHKMNSKFIKWLESMWKAAK